MLYFAVQAKNRVLSAELRGVPHNTVAWMISALYKLMNSAVNSVADRGDKSTWLEGGTGSQNRTMIISFDRPLNAGQ